MKTYKTQRTKTCLWHNMCRYLETNTRKIKPNIEKYIREQQLKYLLSTKKTCVLSYIENRRYLLCYLRGRNRLLSPVRLLRRFD